MAQFSVLTKSAALCSAIVKLMDWEREASSSRLRRTQKEQNHLLGDCLRIAALANLKCERKKCLVLPCLQLRHRTQFKKMDVFAKLWLLYSHSMYLFVCSRSKCSVQAAFLLQLILISCSRVTKSARRKPLQTFTASVDTYLPISGWWKLLFLLFFAAYWSGCSQPVRSVKFTAEIILTLEKLLLIWTIIQNAWWRSPSKSFPSHCLQDSCRSSET